MKKYLIMIFIIAGALLFFAYKTTDYEKKAFINTNSTVGKNNITNTNSRLILVNKDFILSKSYQPSDLVKVNVAFTADAKDEEKYLKKDAAQSLQDMFKEAEKEGIILLGKSGYRSYKLQQEIYDEYGELYGKEYVDSYVALPGTSEHQTGLAIDVGNEEDDFPGSDEAIWLEKNSYKYGFIIRYPKSKADITGISYEPWHIRYVGRDIAKYIYDNGFTLEEYLMND